MTPPGRPTRKSGINPSRIPAEIRTKNGPFGVNPPKSGPFFLFLSKKSAFFPHYPLVYLLPMGYNTIVLPARGRVHLYEGRMRQMCDKTMTFSVNDDKEQEMRETLLTVYNALKEKGYNPVSQIVGYILSEDPTYITTHHNARSLIRRIDRDELLQAMVKNYLND